MRPGGKDWKCNARVAARLAMMTVDTTHTFNTTFDASHIDLSENSAPIRHVISPMRVQVTRIIEGN
jgi:hypothetical protein